MANAGYSGTPLVRKLGIREGTRVLAVNAPDGYEKLVGELPEGASIETVGGGGVLTRAVRDVAFVHLFVRSAAELAAALTKLRKQIRSDGVIWVSWPKRASKIPTDVTEDTIRDMALPMGLVDIKVCAVDEIWSGLKLVIRKSERE